MKIYEIEINATDENSDEIDKIIYSVVDLISELEDDGKKFKITIEEIESESAITYSRYLH